MTKRVDYSIIRDHCSWTTTKLQTYAGPVPAQSAYKQPLCSLSFAPTLPQLPSNSSSAEQGYAKAFVAFQVGGLLRCRWN